MAAGGISSEWLKINHHDTDDVGLRFHWNVELSQSTFGYPKRANPATGARFGIANHEEAET